MTLCPLSGRYFTEALLNQDLNHPGAARFSQMIKYIYRNSSGRYDMISFYRMISMI